jgi:hypothetical protein
VIVGIETTILKRPGNFITGINVQTSKAVLRVLPIDRIEPVSSPASFVAASTDLSQKGA